MNDINQYLTFQVKGQRLALEILRIKEIIEFGRITTVPLMQQCISGVINLRGAVVDISADLISPPPQFGTGLRTDFLRGIGKVNEQFVLLLNVERLLDFAIPSDLESMMVEAA